MRRPGRGFVSIAPRLYWRASLLVCVAALLSGYVPPPVHATSPADPDYATLYSRGITFAEFLESTRAKRDEWRAGYNGAAVNADMVTRMRAIPARRLILVVAEDW